ncbi:MAG TPA: UPF0164 family protein [Treponemataceae bacterium]|nr:UPF0164 family protein [Treponemataceae bacterium]
MNITRARKIIVFIFLFHFFAANALCAKSTGEIINTITDVFKDFVDQNEGTTSFRSLYIPSGGKAEAMGSAFTALANDISFFEYNPAGSCQIENTEFSIFHNSWIADSAVETLAFTQRSNNLGYGAAIKCFYVPFTEYTIFGERVSKGYYSETVITLNLSYNFFSGYTFKGLCIGGNFKTAFRSVPNYADNDTNKIILNSGNEQSAIAFIGDGGLLVRFNVLKFYSSREPNFKIGLAIHNVGIAFTGFSKKIKIDDPLPSYLSAGISASLIRPLTIALEFQQPIHFQNLKESEQWAASAGTSVVITPFFTLLGGFLLRGANPRLTMGAELLFSDVIFNINYTLDMTTSLAPINRISLTAKINLGDRGRDELQIKIDTLYSIGLSLYANGDLVEAIDVWSQILEYQPRFDPAIAGIESARSSLELERRISEVQMLD